MDQGAIRGERIGNLLDWSCSFSDRVSSSSISISTTERTKRQSDMPVQDVELGTLSRL